MSVLDKPEATFTGQSGLQIKPVPIEANTSRDYYQREIDLIFQRAWMIVGRIDEVPEPGDYFVQDIPSSNTSALVVRGRDGVIRAFHNMCRHRGNKVVHTGHTKGRAKGFSCAFHGWTYDLSGKLVIVPDEDQFFDFDKKDHGLTPMGCEVWEGWIFIAIDPRETLAEWLGDYKDFFGGALDKGRYESLTMFAHAAADVKVNWKIFLDAFSEAYHAPFIHGRTLPEAFTPESNPLMHLCHAQTFERHRMVSIPGNPDYRPSPLEAVVGKYISTPVFPAVAKDLEKLPKGINPGRDPYWAVDLNIMLPGSLFMVWSNGTLLFYNFWPKSIDETHFVVKLYAPAPKNAAERINLENSRFMYISVVREDMSSLETTQEAVNSGAIDRINLSDQEILVRHSYKVVQDFIGKY